MIYLYFGENTFLLEDKLRAFKERYIAKFSHALNVHNFDLSESGLLPLKEVFEARSLFDETTLVFVSGLETVDSDSVHVCLKEFNVSKRDDLVAVFYVRGPAKVLDRKLMTYFENEGNGNEFKPYSGSRLYRWIMNYTVKLGASISYENAQYLSNRGYEDMISLSHEIEKLASYARGGEITRDEIEMLVPGSYRTDVFKTIDALARRDISKALSLLLGHRKKGDDPFQIMAMFAYQIRTLLIVKDYDENGVKSSLHPYVIQKNRPLSRSFTMDELIYLHSLVADSDLASKTGTEEPYIALEDLIIAFSAS